MDEVQLSDYKYKDNFVEVTAVSGIKAMGVLSTLKFVSKADGATTYLTRNSCYKVGMAIWRFGEGRKFEKAERLIEYRFSMAPTTHGLTIVCRGLTFFILGEGGSAWKATASQWRIRGYKPKPLMKHTTERFRLWNGQNYVNYYLYPFESVQEIKGQKASLRREKWKEAVNTLIKIRTEMLKTQLLRF